MSLMLRLLRAIIIAFPTVLVGFYLMRDKLLSNIDSGRTNPVSAHLCGISEATVAAPNGVELLAWHALAEQGQPTLLCYHGQRCPFHLDGQYLFRALSDVSHPALADEPKEFALLADGHRSDLCCHGVLGVIRSFLAGAPST